MNRWEEYFSRMSHMVATQSTCLSRQVGAVIVRDNTILSTGYNGVPRKARHCQTCRRRESPNYEPGKGLEVCLAQHAEVNAIANAARMGIGLDKSELYINTVLPCKWCLGAIINAGIIAIHVEAIVYYDNPSRWLYDQQLVDIYEKGEIKIIAYGREVGGFGV